MGLGIYKLGYGETSKVKMLQLAKPARETEQNTSFSPAVCHLQNSTLAIICIVVSKSNYYLFSVQAIINIKGCIRSVLLVS